MNRSLQRFDVLSGPNNYAASTGAELNDDLVHDSNSDAAMIMAPIPIPIFSTVTLSPIWNLARGGPCAYYEIIVEDLIQP